MSITYDDALVEVPACCQFDLTLTRSTPARDELRHRAGGGIGLVIVEGNIASGKTTLAVELAKSLGCRVFLEPTIRNP